jgi:transposase-like protein
MTYTLPHFAERLADRLGRPTLPRRAPTGPLTPRGEDHGRARHTDAEVSAAIRRVRLGEPLIKVARAIGIGPSTLRKWCAGTRRPEASAAML